MKKILFCSVLAASVLLMLSSCKDYAGNEKTHPLFIKAGTAKTAGEFAEAAKCYEDFLMIAPKSSVTHYELGKLYGDSLNDPLKAVYHYEKWLAMNPNDPTNSSDIRVLAEKSRRDLFKKLCEAYKDDPTMKPSGEEVEKLRRQLAMYMDYNTKLKTQNAQMKAYILKKKDMIDSLNNSRRKSAAVQQQEDRQTSETTSAAAAEPQKMAAAKPAAENTKDTTYKVQPGDTLSKISRKYYGSGKYVNLIANANRGKIGKNMQLRVGQTLIIPPKH